MIRLLKKIGFVGAIFSLLFLLSVIGFEKKGAEDVDLGNAMILEEPLPHMMAEIELHTTKEIEEVLLRAEKYVDAYKKFPQSSPIVFILHGDEAEVFRKENYQKYKELVDLAARLEAYNVVDIKVCEMWMKNNNMEPGDVPAFIDTVSFGPWEEFKLKRKGYTYF